MRCMVCSLDAGFYLLSGSTFPVRAEPNIKFSLQILDLDHKDKSIYSVGNMASC